jgi:hypothetical protein
MTRAHTIAALAPALFAASLAHASREAPTLAILDPQALAALEEQGLRVGALAFDAPAARDNAALSASRAYRDLVETVAADLAELYRKDWSWGVGMRYTHRGFDRRWLTAEEARWELAAVMNRVDRRAFHPGTCGELRFVYRLAYTTATKGGPSSSRLPATLNVVFFMPEDEGCVGATRRLERAADPAGLTLKAVELNIQSARWPSTVRPDLGGHADYILRVFHKREGRLRPAPLENTPDVGRLKKSAALRAELLAWVGAHLADIEQGTAIVPERFLAQRAVSVTPRGLARPQNRPFTSLFQARDLDPVAIPAEGARGARLVRDGASLLRRLDGLSCMGCHQSRSLAGFHVVGAERDERAGDALAVAVSPHVEEELLRRGAYREALLAGRAPAELRLPAERGLPLDERGGFGAACGLAPGFAAWACRPGFSCAAVDDGEVGQCMPQTPAVGGACRLGRVDFVRDRIPRTIETRCPSTSVCEEVGVGFPGGMCAAACGEVTGRPEEHAACGAIAVLTPFNDCLARGELFSTCARHARPAALRACGPGDPCRPDYLCARAPEGEGGVCLPPYFVLQMRVDGHPRPKGAPR